MTPDSPTLTPRTDAMIDSCRDYEKAYHWNGRFSDFARQLERELTQARAELARQAEPVACGGKWAIDNSAGRPILVYENCSVIQDEQAFYVLKLVEREAAAGDCREAFEAWALSRGYSVARGADAVETPIVDRYLSYAAQHAWRGFEAALAWQEGGK